MDKQQCAAAIEVRDTYRVNRSRRGGHFKLHYTRQRCSRMAPEGQRYCWQHEKVAQYYAPGTFDYER